MQAGTGAVFALGRVRPYGARRLGLRGNASGKPDAVRGAASAAWDSIKGQALKTSPGLEHTV